MSDDIYDPSERMQAKAQSRADDAARLAAGEVSHADLRRENGLVADLDHREARIVRRRLTIR